MDKINYLGSICKQVVGSELYLGPFFVKFYLLNKSRYHVLDEPKAGNINVFLTEAVLFIQTKLNFI